MMNDQDCYWMKKALHFGEKSLCMEKLPVGALIY